MGTTGSEAAAAARIEDLAFRTKGQLATGILTDAFADGVRLDFICGDEVYGSCTQLREYLEDRGQAYVLHIRCLRGHCYGNLLCRVRLNTSLPRAR